jgi:hypothetical protein
VSHQPLAWRTEKSNRSAGPCKRRNVHHPGVYRSALPRHPPLIGCIEPVLVPRRLRALH